MRDLGRVGINLAQAVRDAASGVVGSGGSLVDSDAAVFDEEEVGEGAADVDAEDGGHGEIIDDGGRRTGVRSAAAGGGLAGAGDDGVELAVDDHRNL